MVRENRKRLRRNLARMAEGKEDGGTWKKRKEPRGRDPERPVCQTGQALVWFASCWALLVECGSFPLSGCARRIGSFGTGHKVAQVLRYRSRVHCFLASGDQGSDGGHDFVGC